MSVPPPAVEPSHSTPRPTPWWLLLPIVVVAFRGALLLRELQLAAVLWLFGCPGAGFDAHLGRGGMRAVGLETCSEGQRVGPALLGVFGGSLVATALLVAFARGFRARSRHTTAFGYLFALATAAEVLSVSVVFSILDRFEPALLSASGVSRILLVIVGVAAGLGWGLLAARSSDTFVWALGRPEHEVSHFRHLVAFKLTIGTAFIALMRVLV
jgi:hypothetical protein